MGLKMTLPKAMNHLYADFIDAYWFLESVEYSTTQTGFVFVCYPSREAKEHKFEQITERLPVGGAVDDIYRPVLYRWQGVFNTVDIFPQGIPLEENAQKTVIYNFIKSYTGLPFEDVIED